MPRTRTRLTPRGEAVAIWTTWLAFIAVMCLATYLEPFVS